MCIDVVCVVGLLAVGEKYVSPLFSEQSVDFSRCSRGNCW